ncbi:MAG: trigger factor, partial [Hyphomicrobiales bacterium]
MNVSEISAKDLSREIKVEVPKGDIENKLVSKLEELKNTVQLKGFRPGKVPLNHLRRVFGQRLMPEVIEETVKETSAKVLSDRNEKPAIQPKINFYDGKPSEEKEKEAIDKVINAGKDLSYTMIYEIIPEITAPKYDTISITKRVAKVTSEDIKEALDRIASENKSYEERKPSEKSKDGDQLTIDFIGKIDGEVFDGGSANDAPLV